MEEILYMWVKDRLLVRQFHSADFEISCCNITDYRVFFVDSIFWTKTNWYRGPSRGWKVIYFICG